MGVIDIILLVCFLPAFYFGIKNGLVKQIISVAVIYFGITLSLRFADMVSSWLLKLFTLSDFWIKAISFVLIFLVVAILLNLIGKLIEKILKIALLGWLNRLLGVVVTLAIFVLILSTIIHFVDAANETFHFIAEDKIAESKLYPALLDLSYKLFPYFESFF
ncbi:MAG TPA: CvpA family protein [Bacteroidales bacterium]|jgi:membrane protein required for colicin V production|nr:CvpA family protein [Bacteroidales bacterium]